MTPSENRLSKFSTLPFQWDVHNRYAFNDPEGEGGAFTGALAASRVENELLAPSLKRLGGAKFVNTRPISGLNCMVLAMSALAKKGSTVYVVPPAAGGHASTVAVANQLGLKPVAIPMVGPHEVDVEKLNQTIVKDRPELIYLDQSTGLAPIDVASIRNVVDSKSPITKIHYDTSHLNGLILFKALKNPLELGATSYGGSTHKTLPGPHKAFLLTNEEDIARQFLRATDIFVSQSHPSSTLALYFTLAELEECSGTEYASAVIRNARQLGSQLSLGGLTVPGSDFGYTRSHQVWVALTSETNKPELTARLRRGGLQANRFGALPGLPAGGLRLSTAEVTRMGGGPKHMEFIAEALAGAVMGDWSADRIRSVLTPVREATSKMQYCYPDEYLTRVASSHAATEILAN